MGMIERIDLVNAEIEEYIANGESRPADYADMCGMNMNEFLRAVSLHQEAKLFNKAEQLIQTQSQLELVRENEEDLAKKKSKPKVRLTDAQKLAIWEATQKGVVRSKLAERYDVSLSSIQNVLNYFRENPPEAKAEPIPTPEKIVEAIVASEGLKADFEGDELVIRIQKKHLTRKLLKDII